MVEHITLVEQTTSDHSDISNNKKHNITLSQKEQILATMSDSFNIASVRERFPSLRQRQVYFDNAGGSQILGDVVES